MHCLPYTATLFQLRLSGLRSCQEWVVSTHNINHSEFFKGQNLFVKDSHLQIFEFHGRNNPLTNEAHFRDYACIISGVGSSLLSE